MFWRVKPKLHIFQELGEFQTWTHWQPLDFWCYADESFVGFISEIARSRGGQDNVSTAPLRTVQRYRALTD